MGDSAASSRRRGDQTPRTAPKKSPEEKDKGKDEVEELRVKLSTERQNIKLTTAPITTVSLFTISAMEYLIYGLRSVALSIFTWLLALPLVAGYFYLKLVYAPELFEAPVCGVKAGAPFWQFELALAEASWWIILGILSSVGFGTGLHSGMMFLFPHILQVVSAAESCHTTTGLIAWYQHPCKLALSLQPQCLPQLSNKLWVCTCNNDSVTTSGYRRVSNHVAIHDGSSYVFSSCISKTVKAWTEAGTMPQVSAPPSLGPGAKSTKAEPGSGVDCSTTTGPFDDSTVIFFNLWCKVTVPCMLWGFGTAIGELPPYLVSKAARLSGTTDEDFAKEMEDAKTKTDLFNRMKLWTVNFTEKHGFWGIFLLASWPNAAFDMCGMCCGYLLMPFWTFFIATSLGKGVVKTNGQAVVFVNLFGSTAFEVLLKGFDYINSLIEAMIGKDLHLRSVVSTNRAKLLASFQKHSRFPPEHLFHRDDDQKLEFDEICKLYDTEEEGKMKEIASRVLLEWDKNGDQSLCVNEVKNAASVTDGKISLSSLDPGAPTSPLKVAWELFVAGLVLYFVVSIMNQMAQSKQAEYDEVKVEELKKSKKKK